MLPKDETVVLGLGASATSISCAETEAGLAVAVIFKGPAEALLNIESAGSHQLDLRCGYHQRELSNRNLCCQIYLFCGQLNWLP